MIKPCKCENAFQDRRYGKGMRLVTTTKDGATRCTVCGPRRRRKHGAYATYRPT